MDSEIAAALLAWVVRVDYLLAALACGEMDPRTANATAGALRLCAGGEELQDAIRQAPAVPAP